MSRTVILKRENDRSGRTALDDASLEVLNGGILFSITLACSLFICIVMSLVAIYAEATLDGDIGLFLGKTNKSVPLSLSPFVRCLSLSCEGPLGLIP